MRRAAIPLAIALTSFLPAPAQASAPAQAHASGQQPIVRTDRGLVRGKLAEGADQFLGIPYAAPPVGPLRWQAPRLAPRWAGVRPATGYGSRCAQLASGNGPEADSEDCLYLNVYTPVDHNEGSLPVLLMIHGGGLVNGAGDQHDGSMIAGTSHIVVVSINYRLGPLGFLTVPGLSGSALTRAGNFGFLDQEAALRWVRRNIAAFGGDPARVTIDGESAGGFSVCALLASPLAAGLFRAAIIQSGGCASQPPALAERSGLAFARQAGCPDPSTAARCLRGLPARELLRAASGYLTAFTSGGPDLPVPVAQAIDDGSYTRVPVLIGANHDEGRGFSQAFANYTGQQYRILVAALYGSRAPGVLARYPLSAYPKRYAAAYAIGDIFTDSGFLLGIGGCPAQNLVSRLAATTHTWFYQFDDVHAPGLNRDLPGYQWGAAHAMELAYLWPGFGNGYSLYDLLTAAQRQLSRQMVRYWGAFTTLGTPDVPGQPYWPGYLNGRIMSLRPGGHTQLISSATYSAEHMCSFWNR